VEIRPVAAVLAKLGLKAPVLAALEADRSNYKLCLLQPKGDLVFDPSGVRHKDAALAALQFSSFLDEARARDADLAVTPEYSMPWPVLLEALGNGKTPNPGKLWALGCESIRYDELVTLRDDPKAAATFIFEDLSAVSGKFADPLAYVFWAPNKTGKGVKLVVLVQFKTEPMSDAANFEAAHLQKGSVIYQFGEHGKSVRLTSLICSDVLDFSTDLAKAMYDRGLILHIQLNADPRHIQFRGYRDQLLKMHGDETELICLNWASGVSLASGGHQINWDNPSNSAWYLKPNKFDRSDATLAHNHKEGLYYTYSEGHRLNALFFNYAPALFVFEATKVAHIAQPAIARRTGPKLTDMLSWNGAAWAAGVSANDGFSQVVAEAGGAQSAIETLSTSNPLFVERLLALSSGAIALSETWHSVTELDSCAIDQNEIIRRMTFCQDPDTEAKKFRTARLKLLAQLNAILHAHHNLPPALADLKGGFDLTWSPAHPHQNGLSPAGKPATLVYVGGQRSDDDIRETRDKIAHCLRQSIHNDDEAMTARQRLAVWHDDGAGPKLFEPLKNLEIDQPRTQSPFDITRDD
jgi:hypothetical protein